MKSMLFLLLALNISLGMIPNDSLETPRESSWFPCAMTKYSAPLKLGWVLGISRVHHIGRQQYHGPFFQIEPSIGGGKINAGYRAGAYRFIPLYNVGISASVLHTWGNPLGDVQPGQTYAGLELSCALYLLGFNTGLFHHIAGDDQQNNWLVTIGIGAGF